MSSENWEPDIGTDTSVCVERRWSEPVKAEPAAARPADPFGNAALFTVDYLLQTRRAVGNRMLTHLNADPVPPHLVCDCRRGSRPDERIEHQITRVGADFEDALD